MAKRRPRVRSRRLVPSRRKARPVMSCETCGSVRDGRWTARPVASSSRAALGEPRARLA